MANKQVQPITSQQLQDVEDLLQTLKEKAHMANQAGDVYMNSVYADLVKVVFPIATRAHARRHREDRARINKGVKELRKSGQKSAPRASKTHNTSAPDKPSTQNA
jgi:hypothetical protein